MPQAQGSRGQLLVQKEDTFKADPGTPDMQKIHFISDGLRLSRDIEHSDTIRSDRNPLAGVRGNSEIGGTIEVELQAYIGVLLEATLGSVATTGAGPYSHTFKVGTSLPSLVIERGFMDLGQYFKYNGCKINRLSFDVTSVGFQRLAFDILGAKETVGAASFDATPTDLGKKSWDGFLVSTIEEGGVSIGTVSEISGLTFDNDLDGDVYVIGGNGERYSLPEGMVKVSGTIKVLFEDMAMYNKAVASTESSLKVKWQFGTGDGSAGNEAIEIFLPELIFSPNAPVIEGPRGIYVELPFDAYYDDSAEATAMQIVLDNTQATI